MRWTWSAASAAPAAAHAPASAHGPETHGDAEVLDFDTDDDDEPRTIVIRGFGPRWVAPPALPGPAPPPPPSPPPEGT